MRPYKSLRQISAAAWILLFLAGCSAYGSTSTTIAPVEPSTTATFIETTEPTASTNPDLPVTGSVQIEGGRCCIGAFAGATLQTQVDFSASSRSGDVSQMRVRPGGGCAAEAQMESAEWEPFVPSKTYPVVVGINWNGFYVSAQFQDEQGNLSPVYCDDISVEGMPPVPLTNPTAWYAQIRCFSEAEVHPAPGETVTRESVIFNWPDENQLPEGVFYEVNAYGEGDHYTALIASGRTRETSLALQIPPERAGDVVWYIVLVDANGTFLDHGRCSSFPASLLTVDPPQGIKGIHFRYRP